jgi:hypothetical protein
LKKETNRVALNFEEDKFSEFSQINSKKRLNKSKVDTLMGELQDIVKLSTAQESDPSRSNLNQLEHY